MERFAFEILSPIHIGNGNKYNQASFFEDGQFVYVIEPSHFLQVLPQNLRRELISHAEEGKRLNLHEFLPQNLKETLREKSLYKIPLNSRPVRRLSRIAEFIKESNRVFIPGSEIKGAIRTAIIYKLLMDKEIFNDLKPQIQSLKGAPLIRIIRKDRTIGREGRAQEQIKRVELEIQNTLLRGREKDAKYDLLKLLQISDSEAINAEEALFVGKTVVLGPRGILRFAIFQELLRVPQKLSLATLRIPEKNQREILLSSLGFREVQKRLMEDMNNIFEAIYEFNRELLNEEMDFYRGATLGSYQKRYIINQLTAIERKNSPQAPVLRIGMGEGLMSLTIWLAIKRQEESLFREVLRLAPNEQFPRSRKLYEDENGNYHTLGWVRIIRE